MNTASTISQRDAYKLMLKDYPDVMSIEQMCEILSISTKTGYRILREGKICCLKVGRAYENTASCSVHAGKTSRPERRATGKPPLVRTQLHQGIS